MQRIRVEKFALNAPTSLKISSAEAVYVPQGAKLPLTLDLPLREDGAITMSLAAGHARVKLKALGVSESIPTVSATLNKKRSWTKNRITASGKVSFAPSGASVVLQRKINGVWADKASAAARHGSYSLSTRAGTVTGRIAHRVILRKKDAVVAASPGLSLKVRTIGFHHFWVKNPVIRKTWTRVKATIADVPGRATIFVRRKTPGDKWRTAYRGRVSDGRFKKRVSVTKRGSYLLKMKIKSAKGVRIVRSPVLAVKVN